MLYRRNNSLYFLHGYLVDMWIFSKCIKNSDPRFKNRHQFQESGRKTESGVEEEYKDIFIVSEVFLTFSEWQAWC